MKKDDRTKIAIVRGKFLNQYEMQIFEPLVKKYDITAYSSMAPFHQDFAFPTVKLPSPMDIPDFPYKMPILNRLFTDAHYLFELEEHLGGQDIVHTAETYYRYTQQCLDAKKRGLVKKVIATVLENIPFNNEGIQGRKEFKERARKELDHIIALTERTKVALLLEGADPEKITVISHGINTERFTTKKRPTTQKKELKILFAGRLERYKGVYEVLYAAKLLISDESLRQYHLAFTFVGDGTEKDRMMEMEQRLGISSHVIHKHATYDAMPEEYHEADIFVAPSTSDRHWTEQYNTTLLEAQASGLAIVTTRSGGIPENVGDAAVLVQPDDVLSLTEAVKAFIINPLLRQKYAIRARERAVNVHNAQLIAEKIAHVYENVLHS